MYGTKSDSVPYVDIEGNNKSKLAGQKCLIFCVLLFLITTIVFALLFGIYYVKYKDSEPLNVCNTPDCITAAAGMIKKMNLSADPCVDFNEYACGRFIRETVLPAGMTSYSSMTAIAEDNSYVLKEIIEGKILPEDPQYLSTMKQYYQSCMNEDQIEAIGLEPYWNQSKFVQDWPTLNPNWNPATFSLKDVIARYSEVYIEPLFLFQVSVDGKNSSKKAIKLAQPVLGLPQNYFTRKRNDSVILAYEKYLTNVAMALNATKDAATQDARNVVDLEIALTKIMAPIEDSRDPYKQYNPTTLVELASAYPELDIPHAFRSGFSTANITLGDEDTVINFSPSYIGNLTQVIKSFEERIVQNLFAFKYALSVVEDLTKQMRQIKLDFDKVYLGKDAESPRWKDCLDATSSSFWLGMSKQFVNKKFSESMKTYVGEMIDNLKGAFSGMIDESTWMGKSTKEQAYNKMEAMMRKIGYPDVNFQDGDIDKEYENFTMQQNNFAANRALIIKLLNIKLLQSLRKPVNHNEWEMPPYLVNAQYSPEKNDITFPAGILQPTMFSETFQDSMNYGGIGVVIGHEITHGFDDQGSQYDEHGNLKNWWQPEDYANFKQRKQCIIDQNSHFEMPEINKTVNGVLTQGESIADNGGLKESYRAYKQQEKKKGKQPILPGLGLSQDQIFFLAYGQVWCEKITLGALISEVTTDEHPPAKFRIIGPLQNSEDFAKAFNCPKGSYMNPENKCNVW